MALNYEYDNFVNENTSKNIDFECMIELEKHNKVYGIVPDYHSKEYLQKELAKLNLQSTKSTKPNN